ncbi:MAG TPA: M20/M25/M40 family metallo-hydrolase [Rhizomicrobium sp.]
MRRGYIVLVVAILFAAWRLQTPTPAPIDAPAASFSASRAFADIRAIAQRPHPVGTADHDRVRDYLVRRLTEMGLAPQLRPDLSTTDFIPGQTVISPVTNIVAVLKGKDREKPALLVMSHYDSVPNSPGAADDSAGVAASLEIARALNSAPQPERDVLFLVTDGEELGMMGATAFFERDPLARHVGVVINFEARGDAGLTAMFETGPMNAGTVAMYAAGASRPSANSLSRAIYKRMPNGSDFTQAVKRDLPGLNFAFIGDELAYHSPLATPAHLDLGSVQHMGDQALAAARAFAAALPEQKADAVYSDILGFFFIQYSFAVGWVLFAVAALLAFYAIWAAWRVERPSWWRGLAGTLLIVLLPVLLLGLAGYSFRGVDHFQRLSHTGFLLAGAVTLAIGSVALIAALFTRPTSRPPALWQTMLLLLLLLAGAAQAFLPEAAFTLVWPLLVTALVAAFRFGLYRGANGLPSAAVATLAALIVFSQTAYSAAFLFTAVGVDIPVVLAMPLLSIVPLLLLLADSKPLPLWTHAVVIAAGVALFAYGRLAAPTPERPGPSFVRYVRDLDDGKAYRVAAFNALDPWTEAALGSPRFSALPWSNGAKSWWAPAEPAGVPPSSLAIERDGAQLRIRVRTPPGAFSAAVALRSSEALGPSSFDGMKIAALTAGGGHEVRYFAPAPGDHIWVLEAPRRGSIDVKLTTTYLDWPKDVAKLPPMPADRMAFGTSGGTQTVLRRTWRP